MEEKNTKKTTIEVKWYSYVVLLLAIVFFSGIFAGATEWYGVLDFNTLSGGFGKIPAATGKALTFRGAGGSGAKDGFIFALSLMPSVILALGCVSIVEGLGGLDAARKLLTPLLRPLLGVPGACGLSIISSLQSTDAGSGMVKNLYQDGHITDDERTQIMCFQVSADGTITNFFSSGAALFGIIVAPIILPFAVMFFYKFVGANILRLYIKYVNKKEQASA